MTLPIGSQGFISLAGEGKSFQALGDTFAFKAHGEQTGGTLEAIELVFLPSVELPTHVHRQFDEAIYVLEGELTTQVGGHDALSLDQQGVGVHSTGAKDHRQRRLSLT